MLSRLLVLTALAAVAAFCLVQDRVTAAGAKRYVTLQRDALVNGSPAVTLDGIMGPAIERSVQWGLAAGSALGMAGLAASWWGWRGRGHNARRRRE